MRYLYVCILRIWFIKPFSTEVVSYDSHLLIFKFVENMQILSMHKYAIFIVDIDRHIFIE